VKEAIRKSATCVACGHELCSTANCRCNCAGVAMLVQDLTAAREEAAQARRERDEAKADNEALSLGYGKACAERDAARREAEEARARSHEMEAEAARLDALKVNACVARNEALARAEAGDALLRRWPTAITGARDIPVAVYQLNVDTRAHLARGAGEEAGRGHEAAPAALADNVLRYAPPGSVTLTGPQREELLRLVDRDAKRLRVLIEVRAWRRSAVGLEPQPHADAETLGQRIDDAISSAAPPSPAAACERCKGSGSIGVMFPGGIATPEPCPDCGGSGKAAPRTERAP
jgi:hypothetical protein